MDNLALGHSCTIKDLFANFQTKKLKLTKSGRFIDHKKRFAASIFITCMQIIIQDIIDNNTQFKLPPVGKGSSYIQMKRFKDKEFKKLYKAGRWRDIDFLASNFTGYWLAYYMNSEERVSREKPIYVSTMYRNQITEKTNQGFTY